MTTLNGIPMVFLRRGITLPRFRSRLPAFEPKIQGGVWL